MTDQEAAELLVILFAMYPVETRNIPAIQMPFMTRGYTRALSDLDASLVGKAIDELVKTHERLPTAARIRKTVMELQRGPRRPGGEAWGDVVRQMKRSGYTRSPGVDFTFEDPLVARCVEALGWQEICRSENAVADRARFIELYDALEQNARDEAQAAPGASLPLERKVARLHERAAKLLPVTAAIQSVFDSVLNHSARVPSDPCNGSHPLPACRSATCWLVPVGGIRR